MDANNELLSSTARNNRLLNMNTNSVKETTKKNQKSPAAKTGAELSSPASPPLKNAPINSKIDANKSLADITGGRLWRGGLDVAGVVLVAECALALVAASAVVNHFSTVLAIAAVVVSTVFLLRAPWPLIMGRSGIRISAPPTARTPSAWP